MMIHVGASLALGERKNMAKEFSKKFSSGRSYEYCDDGAETMIYYDNYGWAYDEIYKDGPLLYEIEEFDDKGNCKISYCR